MDNVETIKACSMFSTTPNVIVETTSDIKVLGDYSSDYRCTEILQEIMKKAELGVNCFYMPEK